MYFFSETDKHTKMLCFKDTLPQKKIKSQRLNQNLANK